jgi:hypothetical protein
LVDCTARERLDGYPKAIFLSAPWSDADKALESMLTESLDSRGFTLLGDHPDHKTGTTGRALHWQQAVDEVMIGCHGMVAVLQPRQARQTTSPYQLPEIMAASRRSLPVLIVHRPTVGVKVVEQSGRPRKLVFGSSPGGSQPIEFPKIGSSWGQVLSESEALQDSVLSSDDVETVERHKL